MEHPVILGEGTFSRVYRVTNSDTGELLVCKVLTNQNVAKREKQLLEAIEHPLFPDYRGYSERGDKQYLLMEYIGGCNLRQYVRRRGALHWRRGVDIVMELAEGLLYLHEQIPPLIYRDMKPDNVMLQQDGRVRLVDVGCACSMENVYEGARDIKQRGNYMVQAFAGSIGYAAPEQFASGEAVGLESDVYALGGLLYFLLTGMEPCGEGGPGGMLSTGKNPTGKNLWGKIPCGLRQIILDAMQKDRRQRIPDMRILWERLSVYTGGNGLKRIWADIKARFVGRSGALFYYEENVWR